ncbi:MAG: ROK family glucokinase [Clostridia bacterium]|nr:ROK family glucokinase [Clostridia bacterium]
MKSYCFGIDVGGTTIKMGLFETDGTLVEKWEIPTRTENHGEKIIADIAEAVLGKMSEKNINKDEVVGVGIGTPGPIDESGVIHKAANLGWGTFNLEETLYKLLMIPVKAGNDANVAALGEMWQGGGKGFRNVVLVTLGTGVGGGIIVNGKILTGSTGAGGEIGHIHINDDETQICGCGNKGCLEQYTSATGIVTLANRILSKTDEPSVLRDVEISAKSVFDAVKEGDQVAIQVAEEFGRYLGRGLAGVAGVCNPEIFVIGGGVSKAGTILFDYIVKNYRAYVFHGSADAKFALATLGNRAGIYGAAKLILNEVDGSRN